MSKTNKPQASCKIAVIGLGCIYPGAHTPLQLWENILSRRRQFREMPDVRLPNHEYYDPDPLVLNKTYQNKAAVIDGYQFNWLDKKIPKQTFESTDIVHWLALDTALQAIRDAGFDRTNLPSEKTGVILGNTLTGEFTRSNQMLLRWPYVRKALRESARRKGLTGITGELESTMEAYYKSVFHPVTEDTLAGGLANTIAGRICNYLDIHGGGYIVDGACSSSLLAVATAANYLELQQMDMVIAGGVDISLDTFELIGFAKTGALTPDEMRVYDKNGKGFLPGEGCGMVVLKRLEDALRDNNPVYAVMDGWGISSDGKGGITAPSVDGQSRALTRAGEKAGVAPVQLDFIEGHGTGTTVGDKVELEAISKALARNGKIPPRHCGVTSFKSIVGHTKAAAGIGAFIKTAMALNRRVLPPTANVNEPNPVFDDKARSLYPIIHGQVKHPGDILHAGVSAMGFGGINSHIILHSGDAPFNKLQSPVEEKKLIASSQSHEIFLFSAPDRAELIDRLKTAIHESVGISYAEMTDLACYQNGKTVPGHKYRAAVIADNPFDLQRKLNLLVEKLEDWNESERIQLESHTVSAGIKSMNLRLGAVFPGQGSQKINMARKLAERYDWAHEIVKSAENIFIQEGAGNIVSLIFRDIERASDKSELKEWQSELKQTNIAQPAITLASLLWLEYLRRLGIQISCVSGHSLGELMAFYAAGLLDNESVLKFSVFRGQSMAKNGSGSMASLQCSAADAEKYIRACQGYVTIANINGPEQTVVSGESEAIRMIIKLAQDDQVQAVELPVSAAFHSRLIDQVSEDLACYELLKKQRNKNQDVTLISSIDGSILHECPDLSTYFASQAINRVDFISTIRTLSEHCDLILEIGPGKVLTGLISGITGKTPVFPVEPVGENDLSFNILLGNAFVSGSDLNIEELYKDRLIRPFIPANKRSFLVNPLERPFPEIDVNTTDHLATLSEIIGMGHGGNFSHYLENRSAFIREVIDTDFKYFTKFQAADIKPENQAAPSVMITPDDESGNDGISGIRGILFHKIQEMTGFDPKAFNDNLRLLDDLNLDSIKSASLINSMAKNLGLQGKINASLLSNATLGELIHIYSSHKDSGLSESAGVQGHKAVSSSSVSDEVYEELSRRTGFPREALSGDHKLLDDLNMDSIKAGAFISYLQKKFHISKRNSNGSLANASVSQIISELTDATDQQVLPVASDKITSPWVNAYTVVLKEEPIEADAQTVDQFWKDKCLVIVHDDKNEKWAFKMVRSLRENSGRAICVRGSELHMLSSFENCCILVLIPDDPLNTATVMKTIRLLTSVTPRLDEMSMLGFLQFNDGKFLKNSYHTESVSAGVVSFASSIHLEKPDLKIRVVEIDRNATPESGLKIVMQEFLHEKTFEAAGYDGALVRRKMEYQLLSHQNIKETQEQPGPSDVFVATGGARGITAECMYAMALKSGCKTALLGSSPVNGEIEALLARYNTSNLRVKYYQCDITDAQKVSETINFISSDLGSITGVLHGAGRNNPSRAEKVTFENASAEIAPKLEGFMNLCESLRNYDIRYFIALTSIIGVTGMPGNSWYAFSNENLDLFMRTLGSSRTRIRSIAYSIWDEIGMGVRLGSNGPLAQMGIGSINPSAGTEELLFWTSHEVDDCQVVVSSSMGGLDTWNTVRPEIAANRFLTDIKAYEPGRELSARVSLSAATDLYLRDHNYAGSLLFPTVFGIEAMAQASCYIAGITKPGRLTIENISLKKPIVVPHDGNLVIGLTAQVTDQKSQDEVIRIFAGISTEESDFREFHFSAEFLIHGEPAEVSKSFEWPNKFLAVSPKSDLYSWLLFQGPKFQNIDKIVTLENDRTEFITAMTLQDPSTESYSGAIASPMITGNPLLRDVLLQSVQLYLTGRKYLPVSIKKWEILSVDKSGKGGMVSSRLNKISGDLAECDVELFYDGCVIEKITGYEVKALESTPHYPDAKKLSSLDAVFSDALFSEFAKYESFLNRKIHLQLYKHDQEFNLIHTDQRHEIEAMVFASMLDGIPGIEKPCQLTWAPNGKPGTDNSELKVSVSHSNSVLLLSAGSEEQGCDIEFVCKREKKEWDELLEGRFSAVLEQLGKIEPDTDINHTRIWCIREALIKSFGVIPVDIRIEKIIEKGIVFRVFTTGNENKLVLTFPVDFLPSNTAIVAAVISLKKTENASAKVLQPGIHYAGARYDSDSGVFSNSFFTTFRDCRGFYGKTHFTSFIDWMGGLRELVLTPIAKEVLRDLGSGKFGMVTNASDIQVVNEAGTLDEISGNLSITNRSDLQESFIDLKFSFSRKCEDKLILLADCSLSTTWVRIEDRGVVKKAPIPDYFMDFLKNHMAGATIRQGFFNKQEYPATADLGKSVYQVGNMLQPPAAIYEKNFATALSHSNTVGNLYYSNYYVWQSRLIDQYLYQHVPGIMTGAGRKGEFLTLHSTVKHLQEAMPFEIIAVTMFIQEYFEKGIKFYFEFHSISDKKRKLAYGSNLVVYGRRIDENSIPVVQELPVELVNEVAKAIL